MLKALGIARQEFHGGAYLGNACHQLLGTASAFGALLRPTFILHRDPLSISTVHTALRTVLPVRKCSRLVWEYSCDGGAYPLAVRFTTLFHKLQQCDALYSVARPLCRHEMRALELRCASFGNWFPHTFPDTSLPPKFHLLTREIPLFAERWETVGLGSEQAVESSNRVVNRLDRTYGTLSEAQTRLGAIVQQLVLEHNPAVSVLVPQTRLCVRCRLPIAKRFPCRCVCQK